MNSYSICRKMLNISCISISYNYLLITDSNIEPIFFNFVVALDILCTFSKHKDIPVGFRGHTFTTLIP